MKTAKATKAVKTAKSAVAREKERHAARKLLKALLGIHGGLSTRLDERREELDAVHPAWRKSAENLLHYLEFRRYDVRPLQTRLAALGLSSLGRAEAHILATLRSVIRTLCYLDRKKPHITRSRIVEFSEGNSLLAEHTNALLGPLSGPRTIRIMVTVPSEAATDPQLVHGLLAAGMDCMRINCAHDDAAAWSKMIDNLRKAEQELGRKCRVLMDLAGPKLRTGVIAGTPVIKCRPHRDEFGRVITAARVLLVPDDQPGSFPDSDARLPMPADFLKKVAAGDELHFKDCRDASRKLRIVAEVVGTDGASCAWWAESTRTFYAAPGLTFRLCQNHGGDAKTETTLSAMSAPSPHVVLKAGDTLILTKSSEAGHGAVQDAEGKVTQPARVPCTLPEVFDSVKTGERIWFDDGKIGGVIRDALSDTLQVEITQVPSETVKLASDKGINLPDTQFSMSALTADDLENLPFVAAHADMIGLSFIERPEDVIAVQQRLDALGRAPAIVLKIETRRAFEAVPGLLLAAMRSPCAGMMIARGDLAVECGFERLAEVQEEMLWICEAAHMPVIWATQVLETLAKSGRPSRSEITDAAMGERAECVMLNKGPHVIEAVETLDDILQRMQTHQKKKQSLLRPLKSWGVPILDED